MNRLWLLITTLVCTIGLLMGTVLLRAAESIKEQPDPPGASPTPSSNPSLSWQTFIDEGRKAYARGDYMQAQSLFANAVQQAEHDPKTDPAQLSTSLNNLASAYQALGKYSEAEPLLERVVVMTEKRVGPTHPELVPALNNLAGLYAAEGKHAQAEPYFRRALAITENPVGADHEDVAKGLTRIGKLYQSQKNYAEAEPLFQRALRIREKAGSEHLAVADALEDLAERHMLQGRHAEAEPLHKRALSLEEQIWGNNSPQVRVPLKKYAALLRNLHRDKEGNELETRANAMPVESQPPTTGR